MTDRPPSEARLDKARAIVAAGGVTPLTRWSWMVRAHVVSDPEGKGLVCDCPDFAKRGPCKHVMAVELVRALGRVVVVAAFDSSPEDRSAANIVCDGVDDRAAVQGAVDMSQGETENISPDGSQRAGTRAESGESTETTMAHKKATKAAPKGAPASKGAKGGYEKPTCVRCGKTNTRKSGHYTTTDGTKTQIWHCNDCGFTWRDGSARKGKGAGKSKEKALQPHVSPAPGQPKGKAPVAAKTTPAAPQGGKGPIIVAPPGTKVGARVLSGKIGGASPVVKK